MRLFSSRFARVYLIPGAVLQSVIVGGGYGTGREIVEYFTRFGPGAGLLGMGLSSVCFAVVLGVTFEVARLFRVYDYRRFFRVLLGPAWVAFEVLYVLMLVLVLAVVASAAGEILRERFGLPYAVGLGAMLALVAVLAFFGRDVIARVLTFWSVVLYAVFLVYFATAYAAFDGAIGTAFAENAAGPGWVLSGFKYAMYNVAIVPAVLFAMRDIDTRREAVLSGCASALIIMIPAVLFHVSFAAGYPEILDEEIPLYWMIDRLGAPYLLVLYIIVLFGTFVETGSGFIQGLNERLDAFLLETRGRTMTKTARAVIAVVGMGLSGALATLGIVALIAHGYGLISWAFFAVYVVPVLTIGLYKIATS